MRTKNYSLRFTFSIPLNILLVALLWLCGVTLRAAAADSAGQDNANTTQLHQLFDQDWDYQMEQNPVRASLLGDRRWNDRWADLRQETLHAQYEHARETLKRLQGIDRSKLAAQDQLSYDVFGYNLK